VHRASKNQESDCSGRLQFEQVPSKQKTKRLEIVIPLSPRIDEDTELAQKAELVISPPTLPQLISNANYHSVPLI
jgi:hypothetical protein